ncbi:RNA polymerase alpha subunit C-terminal domain-containing protein [Sporosarcina gallistercoris]|uniref:RNA polymerase alpha subunit C-terminal domain-containing protein n=1 Tax=Sporosarcina gallistercoris TaxID=2762245 RepID=UPI003D26DCAF
MTRDDKDIKVCTQGHRYAKKSDCPTCPVCEEERKPENGFVSNLAAPARRALENNGIHSLQVLATYTEKELLQFHGLGPASIPKLKAALKEQGMGFKHE